MKQILAIFLFSLALLLIKLNYAYFFTDEILYVESGREYILKSDYTMNLQHPLVAKYMAGAASLFDDRNVFLMRAPFALMGAISAVIVYLIIKENISKKYAFLGPLLFITYPFIFSSTRMVMMESPLHMFILLFHLYFLRFLRFHKTHLAILSGIFMGLAFGTKFNAFLLLPFSLIFVVCVSISSKSPKTFIKYLWGYLASGASFALTYTGLVVTIGPKGLLNVFRAIKDVLIDRNKGGKAHIIGNKMYMKSPPWYYFYYIFESYSPAQILVSIVGVIAASVNRSFNSIYWLLFLVLNFGFFQFLSLKNERYISTMEISLIFLVIIFLENYQCRTKKWIIALIIGFISLGFVWNLVRMKPTSYNWLHQYITSQTRNYTNGDRLFVYGSIRSSRWHFLDAPEDVVVARKDVDIFVNEFADFKYVAFDNDELLKYPNNEFITYIQLNKDKYDTLNVPGDLILYILK